jgi:hypothetical protein
MDVHLSNGTSTRRLRLSSLTGKRAGLGILSLPDDQAECKLTTPTQNGGKSSSMMTNRRSSTMSNRKREFLMLKEVEMKKVTMFKSGRRTVQRHSNGQSSMMIRKPKLELKV